MSLERKEKQDWSNACRCSVVGSCTGPSPSAQAHSLTHARTLAHARTHTARASAHAEAVAGDAVTRAHQPNTSQQRSPPKLTNVTPLSPPPSSSRLPFSLSFSLTLTTQVRTAARRRIESKPEGRTGEAVPRVSLAGEDPDAPAAPPLR